MDPERTSTLFVSEGSIGPPNRTVVPICPSARLTLPFAVPRH
jgi:hypothetical protein